MEVKTNEEIECGIREIFPRGLEAYEKGIGSMGCSADLDINITRRDKMILVKVTQMYSAPQHGLGLAEFVRRMTEAVGLPEMRDHDKISREGCETCDYGSCYGTEWEFFTPEAT